MIQEGPTTIFARMSHYAAQLRTRGIIYGAATGFGGTWDCSSFITHGLATMFNIPVSRAKLDAQVDTAWLWNKSAPMPNPTANHVPLLFLQDRTSNLKAMHTTHVGIPYVNSFAVADFPWVWGNWVFDRALRVTAVDLRDVNGVNYPDIATVDEWFVETPSTEVYWSKTKDASMVNDDARFFLTHLAFNPQTLKELV